MPGNSAGHFNDIRKFNKKNLLAFILEHKEMPLKKILGLYSLNTGIRVKTLEEYVKELRDAEVLE